MDEMTQTHVNNIWSQDKELQNAAYFFLMETTRESIDWAYAVWDDLVTGLTDKDNHIRAISSQLLCHLAISDPENRLANDFEALLNVTRDPRFVTARHCLQAIWRVGLAGSMQQAMLVDGLKRRYDECTAEKNCTLIRYDIIQGIRNLYDATQDETLRETAVSLINTEEDLKYRKKYAKLWPKGK